MLGPGQKTRSWVKASTLRRARYLEIIQGSDGVLGEKFFVDIGNRRSSAANLRLVATAVQIPIFALLALSLLPVDPDSAAQWAFPASIKNLREVLIVVSATLALATTFVGYHHDVLTEILTAHAERLSQGNKVVLEMLEISYGTALFPLPQSIPGRFELGGGFRLFVHVLKSVSAFVLIVLVLGTIIIRIKVLENIYFVPSFNLDVSVWVIGYVLLCDIVGGLIFLLTIGPVRVKSFEASPTERASNPAD